ncbi:hypothetical protein MTP99_014282 [Tenebrio molitor]|nr:hypothetical protein MTP99_014282 [Tenebrio molitor]
MKLHIEHDKRWCLDSGRNQAENDFTGFIDEEIFKKNPENVIEFNVPETQKENKQTKVCDLEEDGETLVEEENGEEIPVIMKRALRQFRGPLTGKVQVWSNRRREGGFASSPGQSTQERLHNPRTEGRIFVPGLPAEEEEIFLKEKTFGPPSPTQQPVHSQTHFAKNCTLNQDVNETLKKSRNRANLLYRIRGRIRGCDPKTLYHTYKTFIRPVIEYRAPIYATPPPPTPPPPAKKDSPAAFNSPTGSPPSTSTRKLTQSRSNPASKKYPSRDGRLLNRIPKIPKRKLKHPPTALLSPAYTDLPDDLQELVDSTPLTMRWPSTTPGLPGLRTSNPDPEAKKNNSAPGPSIHRTSKDAQDTIFTPQPHLPHLVYKFLFHLAYKFIVTIQIFNFHCIQIIVYH